MGIIYCYTNLINGKKYVGQTINPRQRYNAHKSTAFNEKDPEYNSPLHRAFRKYGYENFKYEILAEAETIEELNGLEIYYIANLKT
jgi:group I intron endonuclease